MICEQVLAPKGHVFLTQQDVYHSRATITCCNCNWSHEAGGEAYSTLIIGASQQDLVADHVRKITLDILRTCRQIYEEAKFVIFECNVLNFVALDLCLMNFTFFMRRNPKLSASVHNIRLLIEPQDGTEAAIEPMAPFADDTPFGTLHGICLAFPRLKSLTLNVASSRGQFDDLLWRSLYGANLGGEDEWYYDALLRMFQDSWPADWQARTEVRTIIEVYSNSVAYLRIPRKFRQELVKALHCRWGKELWIDGEKSFDGGSQVIEPFPKLGRNGRRWYGKVIDGWNCWAWDSILEGERYGITSAENTDSAASAHNSCKDMGDAHVNNADEDDSASGTVLYHTESSSELGEHSEVSKSNGGEDESCSE